MRFLTQKQSRLILLCAGLVVLNVIIFLMARYRSSNPSPQRNNDIPTYGEDLGERLQRAGLTMKHPDASYGLLLFLGDSLTGEIEQLQDEIRLLKSQDVDVVIITRSENHLQQKGLTEKVGARIIPDSLGTKFRALGLSEHLGQILLYDTESFQTIAASSPFNNFETVKEALFKASLDPVIRYKPPVYKEPEASDIGKKFAQFPFDSLIEHAQEIFIDLDKLPYENLALVRMVGNQESESTDELMFSRSWAITTDSKNRVFVVDGSANQVFVLNENGALISRFGRKGEGPGEFCSPTEIAIHNDRIFIADACLKVHEFDMSFQVVNTFRHDSETSPSTGIGSIGGILFIPTFPLPPKRTKLIQIFEMREGKLYFINSFYNYFQPGKKYSSQMGAIFSLNQIRFVTDGRRYLAFGRRSENNLFLIDMETRVSYKYRLIGKTMDTIQTKELPEHVPDYAARHFYKMLAFGVNGNLYVLVPGGILEIDVSSFHASPYLYRVQPVGGIESVFGGYDALAVSGKYMFLLSPGTAQLAIFKRKGR